MGWGVGGENAAKEIAGLYRDSYPRADALYRAEIRWVGAFANRGDTENTLR